MIKVRVFTKEEKKCKVNFRVGGRESSLDIVRVGYVCVCVCVCKYI